VLYPARYSLICHVDNLAFPFIGRRGRVTEAKMGTLVFVCPASGEEVSTGVEMDIPTLSQLELAKVYCPHCQQPHHMFGVEYWLSHTDMPITEAA
jgi:hypothetical protein